MEAGLQRFQRSAFTRVGSTATGSCRCCRYSRSCTGWRSILPGNFIPGRVCTTPIGDVGTELSSHHRSTIVLQLRAGAAGYWVEKVIVSNLSKARLSPNSTITCSRPDHAVAVQILVEGVLQRFQRSAFTRIEQQKTGSCRCCRSSRSKRGAARVLKGDVIAGRRLHRADRGPAIQKARATGAPLYFSAGPEPLTLSRK